MSAMDTPRMWQPLRNRSFVVAAFLLVVSIFVSLPGVLARRRALQEASDELQRLQAAIVAKQVETRDVQAAVIRVETEITRILQR